MYIVSLIFEWTPLTLLVNVIYAGPKSEFGPKGEMIVLFFLFFFLGKQQRTMQQQFHIGPMESQLWNERLNYAKGISEISRMFSVKYGFDPLSFY